MNKEKSQLILLIILVFIGINYYMYGSLVQPSFENALSIKKDYLKKKEKVDYLSMQKNNIESVKQQIEDFKSKDTAFDKQVPHNLDSPQLIYDFYTICKKYGVNGNIVTFELPSDKEKSTQLPQKSGEKTEPLQSEAISMKKSSITFEISGDKDKVQNLLNNLSSITERKINLKMISLSNTQNGVIAKLSLYNYLQSGGTIKDTTQKK